MQILFPVVVPAAIEKLSDLFSKKLGRLRALWLSFWWRINLGSGSRFQGKTIVRTPLRAGGGGRIVIGENVVINSSFKSNLVGLLNPSILDARMGGRIEIGDNTGMSSVVISSRESIVIGKHVKIGGNVRIFDHDFHCLSPEIRRTAEDRKNVRARSVEIGDDCFVGTNAIILKGTRLGARTIVAAGAVVFGLDVPSDSMVKGNPAVIVGK